jgi:2-hydroxy-3-keto-5-methylthiopentenyl-1-phosphate phosphatase
MKTLIQCDFDGTVTEEDVSFILLDAFTDEDWRKYLNEYKKGKISVGDFNAKAFSLIKADRQTMLEFAKPRVRIRDGFVKLLDLCYKKGFRFVIVSNGLDFYIEAILKDIGLSDVEIHAARTSFNPGSVEVKYIGPEGNQIQEGFKEAYTKSFLGKGYRVIYMGNGTSDASSAKLAHYIFATGDLLAHCKERNLNCKPFTNFTDVIQGLEPLS